MANKDLRILQSLYESTKARELDFFFIESVDSFDWEKFWNSYFLHEQNYYPLYEEFELIGSSTESDEYKIVSTNGRQFKLFVNFLDKKEIQNRLLMTITLNLQDREKLLKIQRTIQKTDSPILNINFVDEESNFRTTNKLGVFAFSVINGIKDAILASISKRSVPYADLVFFYILKTEQRKLEFFKNTIKAINPGITDCYVDEKSDDKFNLVYFTKTL